MKNINKNIQDAYDEWSATYDSDINRTRDLDQNVIRGTFKGMHFATILEIGCGTGKNTRLLSQTGGSILAVDFSRGMLEVAKERIRARNVIFAMVDLTRTWPFQHESFNLIICNLVLEHIPELPRVFSEAKRSLKDHGRFFVCELHPFRQYQGKQATFSGEKGAVEIPAYVHHVSDFSIAARGNGLRLIELKEWWHAEDQDAPPRLISFMFQK